MIRSEVKRKPNIGDDDKVELRRVQLDLPPRAYERLTALKVETEASTYAEVVKNALKLYAAMIDLEKAGHEFLLKKSDGTVAPLLLFKT